MSLANLSQLLIAFSSLSVQVQLVAIVLLFLLCLIVLVSKKANDNLVRLIVAFKGHHVPEK